MIKKQGKPISGGPGMFRPTPNVLSDSAATSRDAQKLVRQPPAPFQNNMGASKIPAPSHPAFKVGSDFSKQGLAYGATGRSVSVHNHPSVNLAAVGEPRLPKGYNPVNSGFPTRGVQRTVGGGNTPSAKWGPKTPSRSQRAQYPGIFGRER